MLSIYDIIEFDNILKIGDIVRINDKFFNKGFVGYNDRYKKISFKIVSFYNNGDVAYLQEINNNENIRPFHITYLTLDVNYYRKIKLKKLCSK